MLIYDWLNSTDVLIWWGHMAHGDVRDDIVNKVIANAARWAAPVNGPQVNFGNRKPLEDIADS